MTTIHFASEQQSNAANDHLKATESTMQHTTHAPSFEAYHDAHEEDGDEWKNYD